MSTSPPTASSDPALPDTNLRESLPNFVRWGVSQLDLDFSEERGVGSLALPEEDQAAFDGKSVLNLALAESANQSELEPIDFESRFGRWLVDRLRMNGPAVHLRPRQQPTSVNDISERLFPAYRVDEGRVHLGGCQLKDYPFLRLTFASPAEEPASVRHLLVAYDGTAVPDKLVEELGLMDVEPIAERPPRIEEGALDALIAAGRRIGAKQVTERDPTATCADPLVVALIWAKHAEGTLEFTVGENTSSMPFSGWARQMGPQPFVAPFSGASTYHLGATDDGRIDAAAEIVVCQQSGRRVLKDELVTCSVTGRQVLREFTEICPALGKPALVEEFAECGQCLQRVSKAALEGPICTACGQLVKIPPDDPRLVWIMGEHPGLEKWKRWRMSETQNVYILEAEGLMQLLLAVVDKENLTVSHLATRGRFSSRWTPLQASEREELLR